MTYTSDMPAATKKTTATKKTATKKTTAPKKVAVKKAVVAKSLRKNPGLPETKLKTLLSECINADINVSIAPSKSELKKYHKWVRELKDGKVARPPTDVVVTKKDENGLEVTVMKTVRAKDENGKYIKDKFVTKPVTVKKVLYDPLTDEQREKHEKEIAKFKKSYLKKFSHEKRAFSSKKIRFSKGALYVLSSLLDGVTLEIFKAAVAQRKAVAEANKKSSKPITRGVIRLAHLFECDFMNIPGIHLFSGTTEFIEELIAYYGSLRESEVELIKKEYRKELRSEGLLKRRQKKDEAEKKEETEEEEVEEEVEETEAEAEPERSVIEGAKDVSLGYYLKDWFRSADVAAVSKEFVEFVEKLVKGIIKKIALASYKKAIEEDIQKINLETMVEFLTLLSIGDGKITRSFKLVDVDIPDEDEVKKHEELRKKDPSYKYKKADLPTEPSVKAVSEDSYEGDGIEFVFELLDKASDEYEAIRLAEIKKRKDKAESKSSPASEEVQEEQEAPVEEQQSSEEEVEEEVVEVKKVVKKTIPKK